MQVFNLYVSVSTWCRWVARHARLLPLKHASAAQGLTNRKWQNKAAHLIQITLKKGNFQTFIPYFFFLLMAFHLFITFLHKNQFSYQFVWLWWIIIYIWKLKVISVAHYPLICLINITTTPCYALMNHISWPQQVEQLQESL